MPARAPGGRGRVSPCPPLPHRAIAGSRPPRFGRSPSGRVACDRRRRLPTHRQRARDRRLLREEGSRAGSGTEWQRLATASPAVYNVSMTERAMQEATFLILTALAAGAQHGYGIIAEVQQISGGRVRLRAGTLYTALDRLRADGLIGVDREEIVGGRLRRYYRRSRPPTISSRSTPISPSARRRSSA